MFTIDLTGKNALVTGGARGLGAAIVKLLAQCGAHVVIADMIPPEEVKETLDTYKDMAVVPSYIVCDISEIENCKKLVQDVVELCGSIDIVVNNAAIATMDFVEVFKVNTVAQYYINCAARDDMAKHGGGRIVNITTSGTFSGGGSNEVYNAAKGGADSLTRYLAKMFGPDGVYVNAVAPGPMLTDMMRDYHGEAKFASHYSPQMPLGKLLVPDDVARTVLFLCSDLACAVNGETILADAGRVRLHP